MTKHTKWKSGLMGQSEDDTEIWYVRSEDSDPMDVIFGGPDVCICTSESIANQIAAAPELLEALESMLDIHSAHHNNPVHANARTAIAKAQGK